MPHNNAEAGSSKHKERKAKSKEHKHKDKSKHKDLKAKKSNTQVDGPFEHRVQRLRVSVPPKYAGDWIAGVRETLDGMLMRYIDRMGGVLLAHWDHDIVDDTVKIINECPYGVCEVQFHSILWSPKIGQVLYGTHSLSSPSHLSLLFAKTFNVSIPLQHIPTDKYEFEHSENPDGAEDSSSDEEEDDILHPSTVHEVGRWKEKGSNKLVGWAGERIPFTVIGLQVTNQMLSLTGSLLQDPFNPPALPEAPSASYRVASQSPDLPERPSKLARQAIVSKDAGNAPKTTPTVPAVDESQLSTRERKKLRKEQEKAKRDARKAKKADHVDEEQDESTGSLKRKADETGDSHSRKKRKE